MSYLKGLFDCCWVQLLLVLAVAGLLACSSTEQQAIVKKEVVKTSLAEFYEGQEFEKQRELENAENSYLNSISISPRPAAYYRLAEVQRAMGKIAEAKYSVDQAIELVPDYRQARLLKTVLNTEYPNIAPNKPEIPEAPSKTPDDEKVASAKQQQPQAAESLPSTEEVSLDPAGQQLFQEANKMAQAQNWQEAVAQYEKLLQKYPSAPQVHYKYGYALFHLQRYEEAEQEFRRVIQLVENHAEAYNDLGVSLQAQGQISEAENAYQNAISIGQHPDAYYNLAVIKEKKGDYKSAIALYQEYLTFDPSSEYADYAEERIKTLRRYAY